MWCAIRRQIANVAPQVVAGVVLVLMASFAFAQADLSVTATWDPNCDPCPAGGRLTFVQTVTNHGPSPDANAAAQMATAAYGSSVVDASWTTTQGSFDVDPDSGAVVNLDTSGLAYILSATLGVMVPNSTATLTYQVDLDADTPLSSNPLVNSPPDLAGAIIPSALPVTGPGDTDVWGITLDWWTWGDVTADAELVSDGNSDPEVAKLGCNPLVGFTPGKVALVYRGDCQFGVKAHMAQNAGAIGAVLINNTDVWNIGGMQPGTDGGQVTIPVVIIPKPIGDSIVAAIAGGGAVNISMPGSPAARPGEPWVVTAEGTGYPSMWAFGTNDPDCCPIDDPGFPGCCSADTGTNNLVYTRINVTPNTQPVAPTAGFTFAPAAPVVDQVVTFTNTTTGTAPITYAWDFGDGGTSTDTNPTHAFAAAGTYTVTLTATNAAGSDTDTDNVTVTAGAVAPVAGFSWTAAGLSVTFANTTTGTPPITYAWDFGDGGTSTEENPTHAYTAAGTYSVSLTATNEEGSDTDTNDVTVTSGPVLNQMYFVAAAGNSAGAAGSVWATDLEINNPGTTMMTYRFLWLPRDTDNSDPTQSDEFTLAPGVSVRYENVLNEVFAAEDVFGALAVAADSPDAIIMSRTFNQSANGTFGQSIEGMRSSELIQANQRVRVVFMTENDAYRSNLGVLNGTNAPLDIMVARYNSEGTMLGDVQTVNLDPYENTQLNRVLQQFAPVAGYVDVWTETAGGAFAAYGSVLDNLTSDPTTVMPK